VGEEVREIHASENFRTTGKLKKLYRGDDFFTLTLKMFSENPLTIETLNSLRGKSWPGGFVIHTITEGEGCFSIHFTREHPGEFAAPDPLENKDDVPLGEAIFMALDEVKALI
jgi:hypothetical protein